MKPLGNRSRRKCPTPLPRSPESITKNDQPREPEWLRGFCGTRDYRQAVVRYRPVAVARPCLNAPEARSRRAFVRCRGNPNANLCLSPGQAVNLPAEESSSILADDTALMLFGFRFLRQVLFGENTIALKQAV